MEENVVLHGDFADLLQRLNRPQFVVGVHDGDQRGLWTDGLADSFGIDEAVRIDCQVSDFDGVAAAGDGTAFLFKSLAGVQNGFVLNLSGDDVFGGACGVSDNTEDGVIVGFGATTGENDFLGAGTDQPGNLFAGGFDGGAGPPAPGGGGRRGWRGKGKKRKKFVEERWVLSPPPP